LIDRDRIDAIERAHASAPPHQGDGGAPGDYCNVGFLLSQIRSLESEADHWKANHADMVKRTALLSQRPDLPVDRLPAYREMERLQRELAEVRAGMPDKGPWRYRHFPEAQQRDHRCFVESDDFAHDVRLYISGDFADDEQRAAYGYALAARLNGRWSGGLAVALQIKLLKADIGSCKCLTKSPVAKYHAETCPHRHIQEALDLLGVATCAQPAHETIVREGDELVCTACGTTAKVTNSAWHVLQALENPYNRQQHGENWQVSAHAWDMAIIMAMRAIDALPLRKLPPGGADT
jgi:hypothetical protein